MRPVAEPSNQIYTCVCVKLGRFFQHWPNRKENLRKMSQGLLWQSAHAFPTEAVRTSNWIPRQPSSSTKLVDVITTYTANGFSRAVAVLRTCSVAKIWRKSLSFWKFLFIFFLNFSFLFWNSCTRLKSLVNSQNLPCPSLIQRISRNSLTFYARLLPEKKTTRQRELGNILKKVRTIRAS